MPKAEKVAEKASRGNLHACYGCGKKIRRGRERYCGHCERARYLEVWSVRVFYPANPTVREVMKRQVTEGDSDLLV